MDATDTGKLHGPSRYPSKPATVPALDRVQGATAEYRGFELRRAWMGSGHVNVSTARGFYGGFPTVSAAVERIDSIIRSAESVAVKVSPEELIAHGIDPTRDAYRVRYLED